MKRIVLIVLILLLIFLVGCFEYVHDQGDGLSTGESITPDYMAEISRDLSQSETPSPSEETPVGSGTVTTVGNGTSDIATETTTADFEIIASIILRSS